MKEERRYQKEEKEEEEEEEEEKEKEKEKENPTLAAIATFSAANPTFIVDMKVLPFWDSLMVMKMTAFAS